MSDCLGASVPSVIKEYIAVLAKGVPSAARPPVQRDFCLTVTKLTTVSRFVNGKFTTDSWKEKRIDNESYFEAED